jgi:hypothetical protein
LLNALMVCCIPSIWNDARMDSFSAIVAPLHDLDERV